MFGSLGACRRAIYNICAPRHWMIAACIALVAGSNVPPASAQTKLSIAINRNLPFIAVWVAKERGFFANRGLDVTFLEAGGGAELRTAVLSGAVDMAIQSPEGSALLYEQGQRLVNIVATQGKLPWVLVLGKQHKGKVKPGDIAALKGMRLGVTGRGSGSDMQLQALLRRAGLAVDKDVQIVGASFAALIAQMDRGQLDGIMAVEPATTQALDTGGFVFVDYAVGEVYPGSSQISAGALAAPAAYIAANSVATRAAVEAVVDAMVFMSKNADWTSQFVAKLTGLSVDKVRAMADKQFVKNSPVITEEGWKSLVKILKDGGVLKVDPPYEQLVAKQYAPIWDRYAKELAAPARAQ